MKDHAVHTPLHAPVRRRPGPVAGGLGARLSGPGGLYNLGNAVALATGVAVVALSPAAGGSGLDAVARHLAGSPAALAMTSAILVFFAGGEVYHRATSRRGAPDTALLRLGDLVSAAGALLLSVSLWLLGDVVTAAVSTVLLAGGKLGSALSPGGRASLPGFPGIDPFRWAVAASRLPALAGLALALATGLPALAALQSAVLLGCYLVWLRADLLLLRLR